MLEITAILLLVATATKKRDKADGWMFLAFVVVVFLLVSKYVGG